MDKYIIQGGKKLYGEVNIGGCKNALLPILAAAVCTNKTIILHSCPNIKDREVALNILKYLGAEVEISKNSIKINSSGINNFELPGDMVCLMRSSIVFMGAVLGRFGRAAACFPGGCNLGARPIDLHLEGFRLLGAKVQEIDGKIFCEAEKLAGKKIKLSFPSVGATQNIMLAAIFAEGETIIENAAKEPEIIDLANFLKLLGAKIRGEGSYRIIIEGIDREKALEQSGTAEYTIMPDRIIAGTYLCAAAITGGDIRLNDVEPLHIRQVLSRLSKMGAKISLGNSWVEIEMVQRPKALGNIITAPYPGFPTDMQPQIMALSAISEGKTIIQETIFESRSKHVAELRKMGADISANLSTFEIKGVPELSPAEVVSKDLRGGAALILAALAAKGETIVIDDGHIKRGYEAIEKDLIQLGANVGAN